jgi:L-threonylcarbamoyladenylate synthase
VIDWISDPQVCAAARLLQQQAVIAYPTESVWGLGCDPDSLPAVEKLLRLKGRSASKGLILIAASAEQFAPYLTGLESDALKRFQTPQQKPTTWLVPSNGCVPEWISGGHDTLALRVTDHPLAAALCRLFGGPLVSTSANPQGRPAATSAEQVQAYFGQAAEGNAIDAQTPGTVGDAIKPSEIRYLISGEIVREG